MKRMRSLEGMARRGLLSAGTLAAGALAAARAAAGEGSGQVEPGGMGLPVDVSHDGHLIDAAIHYTTYCIVTLFVIMVSILIYTMLFHREGRAKADYDHGRGKQPLLMTAIVLGLTFVIVDVVDLVNAYADVSEVFWNWPNDKDIFPVEVMAQQWAWTFRYPGPDGKFNTDDDIVSLNQLDVPVGKKVVFRLKSKDVIHSLYFPNFRVKQDAIPGQETRLWMIPEKAGTYEIGCAQHCGPNHYKMRGEITVHDAASFAAWEKDAAADAVRRNDPQDSEARWGWEWERK